MHLGLLLEMVHSGYGKRTARHRRSGRPRLRRAGRAMLGGDGPHGRARGAIRHLRRRQPSRLPLGALRRGRRRRALHSAQLPAGGRAAGRPARRPSRLPGGARRHSTGGVGSRPHRHLPGLPGSVRRRGRRTPAPRRSRPALHPPLHERDHRRTQGCGAPPPPSHVLSARHRRVRQRRGGRGRAGVGAAVPHRRRRQPAEQPVRRPAHHLPRPVRPRGVAPDRPPRAGHPGHGHPDHAGPGGDPSAPTTPTTPGRRAFARSPTAGRACRPRSSSEPSSCSPRPGS